jgi:hypothetical protein
MSKPIISFVEIKDKGHFDDLKTFEDHPHKGHSGSVSVCTNSANNIIIKSEHETEIFFFALKPETLKHVCLALDDLIKKIEELEKAVRNE